MGKIASYNFILHINSFLTYRFSFASAQEMQATGNPFPTTIYINWQDLHCTALSYYSSAELYKDTDILEFICSVKF